MRARDGRVCASDPHFFDAEEVHARSPTAYYIAKAFNLFMMAANRNDE